MQTFRRTDFTGTCFVCHRPNRPLWSPNDSAAGMCADCWTGTAFVVRFAPEHAGQTPIGAYLQAMEDERGRQQHDNRPRNLRSNWGVRLPAGRVRR